MPRVLAAPLAILVLLLAGGLARAQTAVPPIDFQQRVLPNGLKVITALDRSTPNVTVQVWYGVGAKNDPPGRSGFAHMFEHMMFKATRDMPAEYMDRLTEDVGGMNNAFTQDDTTAFYEVIPAADLQRLLWAESERMSTLVVDKANFDSERQVVEEELRQRVLASPYGRLFYYDLPEDSFQVHPYHRSAIGSIADLDAATLDDLQNFHATFYRPANATLVVAGNFDPAQLNAWIGQYFGPLTNPPTPVPQVTAVEPPRTGPREVTNYGTDVPLPAVAITWLAPKATDPDAAALQVLDAILTAGKSSRLYDTLVYGKQIAAQVFSSADLRQQLGMFYVGAIVAEGHKPDEVVEALRAQVAALRDAPVSPAELDIAKTQLLTQEIRQRETIEGRANELAAAQVIEGSADRANSDIVALGRVTAADVQRVAQKYLPDDLRVVIRYLPESARPKGAPAEAAPPPPVASRPYTGPVAALAPMGQRQAPPPIGAQPPAVLPTPVERTLSNGMRVIVAHSEQLPLVAASLMFEGGAASDPPRLAGTASLTASLVTEGTTTRSARDIARQSEALGADLAANSGWEASTVGLSVMPDKLSAALAIVADVARNPTFAPDELERARKEQLEGLEVAYGEPGQVAAFATAPVTYAGTSFAHAAGGTPTSLARLTRDDLARFHQLNWRPDQAVLVLTGDITPEAGFAAAQAAFGDWPKPAEPPPPRPTGQPAAAPRNIAIDLPGVGQAAVVVTKPALARTDPRFYQALVANTVLGGGYSARLNADIRIKRGLSYGADSMLAAHRTLGAFTASAQTRNDAAAEVADLIKANMAQLGAAPPAPDELAARKESLIGEYGRGIATASGLAQTLQNLALYGIDLTEVKTYTDKVEAVTPGEVQAVAAELMKPGDASLIVVGDAKLFLPTLKPKAPNLEVIPITEFDPDNATLRRTAPPAAHGH
ncbi:MAG TPA: pitrilysin family protein [Caulobacteraceae bacterium]|nr:pitrilysin family protein [Caulobacteraceae bacterium]